MQINGFATAGMSHRRAVEIIQAGGNMIRLGVRRPLAINEESKGFIAPSSLIPLQQMAMPPPSLPFSYAPTSSTAATAAPPPDIRLPQYFTPLPVQKTAVGPRPILSSGRFSFSLSFYLPRTNDRRYSE